MWQIVQDSYLFYKHRTAVMCIMLKNEEVLNNSVLTEYLRILDFIVRQKATAQGQVFTSNWDVQLCVILRGLCPDKTTPCYSNKKHKMSWHCCSPLFWTTVLFKYNALGLFATMSNMQELWQHSMKIPVMQTQWLCSVASWFKCLIGLLFIFWQ